MKFHLLILLLALTCRLPAQECTDVSLLQKPGSWKEGMKGSVYGIPATELASMKKLTAMIQSVVKPRYTPRGVQALTSQSYERLYEDVFYYRCAWNIYFMPYYCKNGAFQLAHETSTNLFITSNNIGISFSHDVVNAFSDESDKNHYGWLTRMPLTKDGCLYFEDETSGGFGTRVTRKQWLAVYDNKLPWQYVSRKEFLEKIGSIQRKQKQQEVKRIEENYASDKKRMTEVLAQTTKRFDELISAIDKVSASLGAAELQLPAIVPFSGDFKRFLKEGEQFSVVLIKDNPAYYNTKIAKSQPQVLRVELIYDQHSPVLTQAYNDLIKSFDFVALKNMLGRPVE